MPHQSSVLYANKPGAKFDLDYYLKTHMPLVAEQWTPYGLKSWEVVQYEAGLNGKEPDFTIEAILVWESLDAVKTATTSDAAKKVFGDIPNFTDITPSFIAGKVVGTSN